MKYISNKKKSIFISLKFLTIKEGIVITKIFESFVSEFGIKKFIEIVPENLGSPIIQFLPEKIKKYYKEIDKINFDALPFYLLKCLIPVLSFLSEKEYILIIDDIENIDYLSLTLLTSKIPIKIAFSSSKNDIVFIRSIKYNLIQLQTPKYELIEEIVGNIIYYKIDKNDLEKISKIFENSGLYVSEIIEGTKFLISERIIIYDTNKGKWIIKNEEAIKTVKSYFAEKIKKTLLSLNELEKEIISLVLLFNQIKEKDIIKILDIVSKESIYKLETLELIDRIGSVTQINHKANPIIVDHIKIEDSFYKKIEKKSLDLFDEYPIPVLEILSKTDLFDEYLIKAIDKIYEEQNYISLIKFVSLVKDDKLFIKLSINYIYPRMYPIMGLQSYDMISIIDRLEKLDKIYQIDLEDKIKIYLIISRYFFIRNNYMKIIPYIDFLSYNMAHINDENILYMINTFLFGVTYFKGDIKLAEEYGSKALAFNKKIINDQDIYIHSLFSAAQAFLGKKEGYDTARRVIREGLTVASVPMMAICFHFSGYALNYLGYTEEGLEFSKESRNIGKELKNVLLIYSTGASIAKGFLVNNMVSEAIEVLKESIEISEKYKIKVGIDHLYNEYLEALFFLRDRENFEKAFIYFESLQMFFTESKWYKAIYYKFLGIEKIFKNEFKEAEDNLRKAYEACSDFKIEKAKVAGLLYHVYANIGEYTLAKQYLEESNKIFDSYENNFQIYKKNFIFKSLETYSTQTTFTSSIKDEITFESIISSIASLSSINIPKNIVLRFVDILFQTLGAKRIEISLSISGIKYSLALDNDFKKIDKFSNSKLIQKAIIDNTPIIEKQLGNNESILIYPVKKINNIGYIYLSNPNITGLFKEKDIKIIKTLTNQTLILLENAILLKKEKEARNKIEKIMKSFELFVPKQFLEVIASEGVEKISLGTAKKIDASILFCDIRDFTSISEKMDSLEVIKFLNEYMKVIASIIEEKGGFIDKFIGDAILGIFDSKTTDDVIDTAVLMCKKIVEFNEERNTKIKIGIGINSSLVTIGTIGTYTRMDSTVIGDGVNLASRLEGLTKMYKVPIVVSDFGIKKLSNTREINYREIDSVIVKGKEKPVVIYEVFEWEDKDIIELKKSYNSEILMGLTLYKIREFKESLDYFQKCKEINKNDPIIDLYIKRCEHYIQNPPPDDWQGAIKLYEK